MRDFHLRFYLNRWPDSIENLLKTDIDIIPDKSGAYVLGTADNTGLIYPWGGSPIFYIGKADSLRQRLSDHKKYTQQAIDSHDKMRWWPRYQYGASFGVTVAWYSTKGKQNPNSLETDLINQFDDIYGSIPVANGAWPTGLKKPTHGKRDD